MARRVGNKVGESQTVPAGIYERTDLFKIPPGHLIGSGHLIRAVCCSFRNPLAIFIKRPVVKVYLPKTDLRGEQFHCYLLAVFNFRSLWLAVCVNFYFIFTVKYWGAVITEYRIAVFGHDGFLPPRSPVNALAVINHTMQVGLGRHSAFEHGCPGGKKIVIKAFAAQIALKRTLLYRRRIYAYKGGIVFNIENNFVGDNPLGHVIYSKQSDFQIAVGEYPISVLIQHHSVNFKFPGPFPVGPRGIRRYPVVIARKSYPLKFGVRQSR